MASPNILLSSVLGVLVLGVAVGCSPAPAPQEEAVVQSPLPESPEEADAGTGEFGESLLWADPLASCDMGQVTTLHWSEAALAHGPASIELGETEPGVFARVGAAGQKETGPWAYPGFVVVLRSDDGVARARLVMKSSVDCPPAS